MGVEAATRFGVWVGSAPTTKTGNDESVAEAAVLLMLAASRRPNEELAFTHGSAQSRPEKWEAHRALSGLKFNLCSSKSEARISFSKASEGNSRQVPCSPVAPIKVAAVSFSATPVNLRFLASFTRKASLCAASAYESPCP